MFAHRTIGVAAATLGVLILVACEAPDQNTDLRPEGPPEVLAVLVMSDASFQLVETATYCKSGDELRPTLVGLPDFTTQQVCPDEGDPEPVTNAYPDGWYVRIMFDELLDPSIEELTPVIDAATGLETGSFTGSIAATRPVILQCRSVVNNQFVNVDYDGYYSPSGNRVTWPVGPSLVIKPNDPTLVATNTECQVTLTGSVLDKQGEAVPESQRGPYTFSIAPITVLLMDPPFDDPSYTSPIDALTMYYDNAYVQFNTSIDYSSICPDEDGDGLCDDEATFSITDNAHPTEGPGYCDTTLTPCGSMADCDTGMGDTLCGRGFCGITGGSCNAKVDCPDPNEHCGTNYAYDYLAFGSTDTEWGLGPVEPLQTEREYTFKFTAGAKLKDRCGRETTLSTPSANDLTLARFVTSKFDLNGTTIVTGEVASAMKRLQYNFNNVLVGSDSANTNGSALAPSAAFVTDGATPGFTISPLPKKLTAPCPGGGAACTTTDLDLSELLILSGNFDGQTQLNGHLQMNTEYTATLKVGTMVSDFYGATWTVEDEDLVITWRTQPAILMTGIAVRNTGQAVSIGNNGTLVRNAPGNTTDVRFTFNASIDPTSFDTADFRIEPAVEGITFASPSGCGHMDTSPASNETGWIGACSLRLRGAFAAGTYKITFLAGAKVKDIFGLEYTHPTDSTITVNVAEASGTSQCL